MKTRKPSRSLPVPCLGTRSAPSVAEPPSVSHSGLVKRARFVDFKIQKREDGAAGPGNIFPVVASTDEPYDWGFFVETLVHEESAIDRHAAVTVLFNHDRACPIGKILNTRVQNGQMCADLQIDSEVEIMPKLSALRAISEGILKGVSVGYGYDYRDCESTYQKEESTDENGNPVCCKKQYVKVKKWTLREISITPTPADLSAQVTRQFPESWTGPNAATLKSEREVKAMNFNAWLKARGFDPETLGDAEKAALKKSFDFERKGAPVLVADPDDDGGEVTKERKALAAREKRVARAELVNNLRELAKSHGLPELTKTELEDVETMEEGCKILLGKKAVKEAVLPKEPVAVEVVADSAEKADAAAEDGLLALIPREFRGVHNKAPDLGMRTGSVLDIGRHWLHAQGMRHVLEMGRQELADSLIGNGGRMNRFQRQRMRKGGQRDAANVTSGMFTSYLLANVLDKAVYNGFMASEDACTHHLWTASRLVSDFKSFTGGALDVGNLVETTENLAFPELAKEEGGYSAALAMWGATLSLTIQALINDDLGEFMKWLGRAGFIARRTIDVKVYTEVAAATWTSRTTAGNLTDATLSANRASMANIAGPAGQALGMNPRFLIVPAGLRSAALTITQLAPALLMNDVIKVNTDIVPIITPFLTTDGTPANSTWYIAAAQAFEACIVAMLAGMEAPVVEEYDAGAVAARKWKIMLPFKVIVPTVSSKVQGMWRGTNA